MTTLSVSGLAQGYGSRVVLSELSLGFTPGVTALLGPNGAGKTTLLRTLATVLPPRAGTLTVAGTDVRGERGARAARRHIGYLPQSFGFDASMRVRDFVTYAAWLRGVPRPERRGAVEEALAYVGLVAEAAHRLGRLSGGMRQRAGIAWAVVGSPGVVILDEPTVGLDPQQRMHFRQVLAGLEHTTVLLSTHLTDDVDAVCQRAVVMDEGVISFEGTTAELRAVDDGTTPGHTPLERAYTRLLSSASVS